MLYSVLCLRRSDSVCVIGIYAAVIGLELSALLPCKAVAEIACRVALCVIGYRHASEGGKKILPGAVSVCIGVSALCENISALIVCYVYRLCSGRLGDKLSEHVV